ncbi:hypothetical protein SAMN05444398_101861 [Roseovarius pacificus]|uniref:Uncharacterized protein n=1 Tax=Roseovarius pacificus TaxID=337701 RepID=A0A1M6YHC2_9RHOB|nr:hypothetical protein [Roseovarius pacificus]GGO50868.1 hypothetical protein GCM10011315_02660 [Roseovarius pacificus]SHL17588.1 hypothetical protein SAMN05444398_101861 [Roseovarius pacificus]
MTDTTITQEDYITEVLASVDTALNDPHIEWADIDLIRNEVQIALEGARLVAETMREAALDPGKVAWPPQTEYEHQVLQLRRVFAFETVRNRFRQARENAARKGKKGGAK